MPGLTIEREIDILKDKLLELLDIEEELRYPDDMEIINRIESIRQRLRYLLRLLNG